MKLTLENYDIKVTAEIPEDSSIEDLIQTFYGLCISVTFLPDSILKGMIDFIENHSDYSFVNNNE